MVRFASLLHPVTDSSIHYWAIPTYSLTNCTNWWVDPGSSDLGMYYREHPYYSHRHLNKHPVPFCFSIVYLFSEKEDPIQKSRFPCCSMSGEDQTDEGTFSRSISTMSVFFQCPFPKRSGKKPMVWRILLFQKWYRYFQPFFPCPL